MTEPGFTVTNRRGRARQNSGLIVGESVQQAKDFVGRSQGRLPREGISLAMEQAGDLKRRGMGDDDVITEMRKNRRIAMRKQGFGTGGPIPGMGVGGANLSFATGRPRDPMFYWRQNNIPWDITKDDELKKIREFCRLLYLTHPVIAACTDIFTKYPIQGMHFDCKDEQLEDFYSTLFFDQLDYENYFIDMGRERWTVGEAWPLGTFNEILGVWEDDELLNPDDVQVEKSPFLREPRFLIKLPETLRRVIQERSPRWEYDALMRSYPELSAYSAEDSLMPVSNVLLKQIKFKADTFHKRGIPILMRGFRAVIQEEMLNAAMDAIADRLYTPLVLAKVGAPASDLGTDQPWIPTANDLENFQEAVDAALAGDFRMITYHFAVDMVPVFGRENMPDLTGDFERVLDRILMVYGISRTMLQGADCLAGDTEISVRRAGKTFRMQIKDVVARFNGDDAHLPARRWTADIPTYVAYAQDGVVRQGLLGAAWESGTKEVFELTTESGRSVTASATHPFLTPYGEFVQLGDLRVGDLVQVNVGRRDGSQLQQRVYYQQTKVRYHPYQNHDGLRESGSQYKVGTHRLVVEAHLNGLPYAEFVRVLRTDEMRSKELVFIDPERFHVHHQDEDKRNNALDNLVILPRDEHLRHHVDVNWVLEQIGSERIVSIVSQGEQPTYDLGMAVEPHNFLANGFVVHNSGETYAADALNRDIMTQLLTDHQKYLNGFYKDRALIVAEAQEHYDYDVRGGQRYVKMEEIFEKDEETEEERIIEQPKLLIPDLRFDTINLADEQVERQFTESLNAAGVPVPYRTRLTGTGMDFDDIIEERTTEQVALAVAEQETRKQIYLALRNAGLPIAEDLLADFQPLARPPQAPAVHPAGDATIPSLGSTPQELPALAPTPEDLQEDEDTENGPEPADQATGQGQVIVMPQQGDQRPPESDEARATMPKPARKIRLRGKRFAYDVGQIREATRKYYEPPDNSIEVRPEHFRPEGRFGPPRHIGMRRHVHIPQGSKWNSVWDDEETGS